MQILGSISSISLPQLKCLACDPKTFGWCTVDQRFNRSRVTLLTFTLPLPPMHLTVQMEWPIPPWPGKIELWGCRLKSMHSESRIEWSQQSCVQFLPVPCAWSGLNNRRRFEMPCKFVLQLDRVKDNLTFGSAEHSQFPGGAELDMLQMQLVTLGKMNKMSSSAAVQAKVQDLDFFKDYWKDLESMSRWIAKLSSCFWGYHGISPCNCSTSCCAMTKDAHET